LYWELRAAVSYAQYLSSLRRSRDAHALLKPVCEQFTQGLDLPQLRTAHELLEQWADTI
jgi:non-specific serine/threonine protein kinase